MNEVILEGMKTAVSIPDAVFRAADKLAKRKGWSRSELYARAIDAFVRADDDAAVTAQLNKVYANEDSRLDSGLAALSARVIGDEEW
jgi:metal-responsive CopG/Arc/MetJ family transcriptional regulator